MGRMISFKKNGVEVSGYLSEPEFGKGPMVFVFHEWWGLVDHIKDVCDRYAKEGFYAFGIDLYKGCLLYTSPSPRDRTRSRMPSSA